MSPSWVKLASAGQACASQASASPPPGPQLLTPHSAASRRSQTEQKERRGFGGWALGSGTGDAPPIVLHSDVQTRWEGWEGGPLVEVAR